jgi:hypothetical protein
VALVSESEKAMKACNKDQNFEKKKVHKRKGLVFLK